jgi:hypothetical protein
MEIMMLVILGGLFLAMLFLNVYFRVKVLAAYKVLVQNRIEFDFSHVFNSEKMRQEVLEKYPEHTQEIQTFIGYMRRSIHMATVLMLIITLIGGVFMYFRE